MCLNKAGPRRKHWWTEGAKVELIMDSRYLATAVEYILHKQPHPHPVPPSPHEPRA